MRLTDCGEKVVIVILDAIRKNHVVLPAEMSLQRLEELSGCRAQSIGMSFDDSIKQALLKSGIKARKCGRPVVLQLSKSSRKLTN